jgi:hypothetical protein
MKKVFIIHGFGGEPNGGWRPWLMGELAKKDIYACALPMPTPEEPKREEWVKTINDVIKIPSEEIFLVGHSLGVPTILHYLENLPVGGIGGVVLVSGPIKVLSKDKYRLIDHFMNMPFDFEKIKNTCKKFVVIHGDNDQAVPFDQAKELSKNLSCELISIPNGEHLNGSSGWYKLPELLESLEKIMN